MTFGSARLRFLQDATPAEPEAPEPSLGPAFEVLAKAVDLLASPGKFTALIAQAKDAQAVIDKAAKATADLVALEAATAVKCDQLQRDARATADRLVTEAENKVSAHTAEIRAAEDRIKARLAKAADDTSAAEKLKAEMERRLRVLGGGA
jgi:cell division septum initiation protein DivIVA